MAAYLIIMTLGLIFVIVFLKTPASVLAGVLKAIVPVALIGGGVLLILAKQAAFGTMLLFAGISVWKKFRTPKHDSFLNESNSHSHIRCAAFEMEVDENSVAINGLILVGSYEGRILEELSLSDLMKVRREVLEDEKSLHWLDTYLDRRFSGRRENA